MEVVVSEEAKKVNFYEKVYIPYLKGTFEEFLYELESSPNLADQQRNERALELLNNMAALLRRPDILDSSKYGDVN